MLLHCPRCQEPVRLPEVAPETRLRCPWCREEYSAGDAAETLPPLLEVVSPESAVFPEPAVSPETMSPDPLAARFAAGDEPAVEQSQYDFAGLAIGNAIEVPAESFSAASQIETASPAASPAGRSAMRRRSSNPLVSLLKVAGGGVAGIVLALLILQVIGRAPDLGVWPFEGPGSPLWSVLASSAEPPQRRAITPSPRPPRNVSQRADSRAADDGPQQAAGQSDRPRTSGESSSQGRSLPLPGEKEFALTPADPTEVSPEREAIFSALEQLTETVGQYHGAMDGGAEMDGDTADAQLGRFVERLAADLRAVGAAAHGAGGLQLDEKALLDTAVIAIARDMTLLRGLIDVELQGRRDADAGEWSGRYALGIATAEGENYRLRGARKDGAQRLLELADASIELPAGKATLVVGADQEASGPLRVYFARALKKQ